MGSTKKGGRPPALTENENRLIVDAVIESSHLGATVSGAELCELVGKVTKNKKTSTHKPVFKNCTPSHNWLKSFRRKNATDVRFARPLRQENKRFCAINSKTVVSHFATLEKIRDENDITIYRCFNLDEVGMSPARDLQTGSRERCILPRRGRSCTNDQRVIDFAYENYVSAMPVVSASGELGPMLVVIKGVKIPYRVLLRDGKKITQTPASFLPRRALLVTRAERGSVDAQNFLNWAHSFVEYVRDLLENDGKVLLTYDAYRAHLSVEVLDLFRRNNIIAYAIPAHARGKLQPLDVTTFSSLKGHLRKIANECVTLSNTSDLDMFDFFAIFGTACRRSFTQKVIASGFRRSGLWPIDATRIINKPLPSTNSGNEQNLCTVSEMSKQLEARRVELRNKILGSDAQMLSCGFVDTTNGCTLTSDRAYALAVEKSRTDIEKREADAQKQHAKQLKDSEKEAIRLASIREFWSIRNFTRAALAKMSVSKFTQRLRSLQTRRLIAKKRTRDRSLFCWSIARGIPFKFVDN